MYKVHIRASNDDSSFRGCYVLSTCKRLLTSSKDRNALIFRVEVKLSNCFSVTLNMIWRDIPEDLNLFCQHRCENVKCLFYCVELFVFCFGSENEDFRNLGSESEVAWVSVSPHLQKSR